MSLIDGSNADDAGNAHDVGVDAADGSPSIETFADDAGDASAVSVDAGDGSPSHDADLGTVVPYGLPPMPDGG